MVRINLLNVDFHGNRLAKRLQSALEHSFYAKLLAVRKVTQTRGKRTPGIDGELLLTPTEKMRAALQLGKKEYHAKPLKRIFIPKPGKITKRPLSIPTIFDRATQALYAICLQPFAETLVDDRSFGFRIFRRAQDACEYAFCCLNKSSSAEWILEGEQA
ncbi:MAG: reverse transcriptase N-terminal domain-containing protein [Methanobacteriota archaeon]